MTPPLPDDGAQKSEDIQRPESRASNHSKDRTPLRNPAERRPPTPELPEPPVAASDGKKEDEKPKNKEELLPKDTKNCREDSRSRDDRDRRSNRDDRADRLKRKRDDEVRDNL